MNALDVALADWLEPFAPAAAGSVLRAVVDAPGSTLVVGPVDPSFGLRPVAAVRDLLEQLEAARGLAPPGRVFWLLDQSGPGALSVVEAEAMFGMDLALDLVEETETPDGGRRLLVGGRTRDDILGILLELGGTPIGPALSALETGPVAVAVLLLRREQAVQLLASRRERQQLRRLVAGRDLGLGLIVAADRTAAALPDLAGEVAPLRELAGDSHAVQTIRFDDPHLAHESRSMSACLAAAGLWVDVSLSPDAGPGPRPYLPAGAFQPQEFDLRVPTGQWHEARHVEVVRLTLGGSAPGDVASEAESWPRLWARRARHRLPVLTRLVAFKRKERYFRAVERNPLLWQSYAEFLVYNWPVPDPFRRVTLVDAGTLDDRERARQALDGAGALARTTSVRIVGHTGFLAAARDEARAHASLTARAAIDDQIQHHGYLAAVDRLGPLRQDLVDFVAFVPPTLGRTLEIGSGFGQLARHLAQRASAYVCVDLVPATLATHGRGISADAHRLPIAAATVDSVIANNSLEHLYEPVTALAEVTRVLRPGGRLYALIPLDGLEPAHRLPAHLWKADQLGIELACRAAGLTIHRIEVANLYELGVQGAFPSCHGLVAKLEASPA